MLASVTLQHSLQRTILNEPNIFNFNFATMKDHEIIKIFIEKNKLL